MPPGNGAQRRSEPDLAQGHGQIMREVWEGSAKKKADARGRRGAHIRRGTLKKAR